jgi:hypothetical protein
MLDPFISESIAPKIKSGVCLSIIVEVGMGEIKRESEIYIIIFRNLGETFGSLWSYFIT